MFTVCFAVWLFIQATGAPKQQHWQLQFSSPETTLGISASSLHSIELCEHLCFISIYFVTLWARCACVLSRSVVSKASLFMGFPRQEYWSGLPFPSLQDLLDPGIKRESLSLPGGFLTDELPGKSTWTKCGVVQSLSHVRLFVTHGLQHARLLCPSWSPRVCSNSCPLSQWCHPTISYSVAPSPPALNPSQHQGLFQWVGSSHQGANVWELQLQHQSFQWIFRDNFL